ncbi:MAG: D-glycero-beta-D-manno-heptose-7-phosphate kinase [Elusimicrobiota bacterium]
MQDKIKLPDFSNKTILVLGDLMVDRFVYGSVSRISPEAPVPVVEVNKDVYLPGGAGNVSNNIVSLGGRVKLVSVIGKDRPGEIIIDKLQALNVDTSGVFVDKTRPTTIKTRIIAGHQQVVRYDNESRAELSTELYNKIKNFIIENSKDAGALLISDYGKGVIRQAVFETAIKAAGRQKMPVTVDPKVEHFLKYKNITSMTPNLQEAIQGMRLQGDVSTESEIFNLGLCILRRLNAYSIIITLGERGMAIFEKGKKPFIIPTAAREVFDVTGAGDTVIAVLTLCLASGVTLTNSAKIANYAAGIVVGKLGTATVSISELKRAMW